MKQYKPLPDGVAVMAAAMLYFGIIFALAFATGVARVLVIAPRIGAVAAVLIEVPFLWVASVLVIRQVLRIRPFSVAQRWAVGGIAFAILMCCEAGLAAVLLGQSVSEWALSFAAPAGLCGLAGQVGFAAIPALLPVARAPDLHPLRKGSRY